MDAMKSCGEMGSGSNKASADGGRRVSRRVLTRENALLNGTGGFPPEWVIDGEYKSNKLNNNSTMVWRQQRSPGFLSL